MQPNVSPTLYSYYDYRQFLKDFMEQSKKYDGKFSYRYFSNKAGFASTNFLSLVVKGKRNLTMTSIGQISKALKLSSKERGYFESLVFMNQATTHEDRDHYFQKILKYQKSAKIRILDRSSYEYFSTWYNPVIREIITFAPQPCDPGWIADRIIPRLTKKQVEKSIDLLLSLGLIFSDKNGCYKKREASLTTGPEVLSLQIANFQKQMIQLSAKAIDLFKPKNRDVSGLVLSINKDKMAEIKRRINVFRNELIELAEEVEDEDQVIYVQISAFPLTKLNNEV